MSSKRDVYKRITEKSLTSNIRTSRDIKTIRTNRTYTRNNKRANTNNIYGNALGGFKRKLIGQSIISIIIVLAFYYIVKDNSESYQNITAKIKEFINEDMDSATIENRISSILSNFTFSTNIVKGTERNVEVDEELLKKIDNGEDSTEKK